MNVAATWLLWLVQLHVGNAYSLPLLWTAFALVGFLGSLGLLREAFLDLYALKTEGVWPIGSAKVKFVPGGARHVIARANIRNLWHRLIIFTLFSTLGALSVVSVKPTSYPSVASVIFSLVLICIEAVIALGTLQDHRDRRTILLDVRHRFVVGLFEATPEQTNGLAQKENFKDTSAP